MTERKSVDTTRVEMENVIQDNLMGLTTAALSSSLGDIRVLQAKIDGGGIKYIPVKDDETMVKALQYIAEFGNSPGNIGYFILQQDKPDMRAWDMLTNRLLGKVAEQVKIDTKITAFIGIAQRAFESRKEQKVIDIPGAGMLPSVWMKK